MKILNKFGRLGLKVQKHSPELFLVGGIAAGIAGTVMACRATLKVDEVLTDAKDDICRITDKAAENLPEYTEEDKAKDMMTVKVQTGLKVAKLYLPAVGLGALAIGCVCKGHGILNKRNAGLAAAYAAVSKSYDIYRQRVIEAEGEAKDREYKYGIKSEKVKAKVTDPETGKEKTKTITQVDVPTDMSEYGVWFSQETSTQFSTAPGYNLAFLKGRETYWNHILQTRGHVFLNEILEDLGMKHTQAGQVVGWIVDKNGDPIVNPETGTSGNGCIDFGIFDNSFFDSDEYNVVRGGKALNGEIYLDFNVDGIIWNMI